jgi:hypothetical protein
VLTLTDVDVTGETLAGTRDPRIHDVTAANAHTMVAKSSAGCSPEANAF